MKSTVLGRLVVVKFEFKGVHAWTSIPASESEEYLRYPHRHTFKVRVVMPVDHSDRQIEIIAARDYFVDRVLGAFPMRDGGSDTLDLGSSSCEQLAEFFATSALNKYPVQWAECEVLEDGECGGIVAVKMQVGE